MTQKPLSVLLEMRPALDGYAGIPQETRLLYRALCKADLVAVDGLLQTSLRFIEPGMPILPESNDGADNHIRVNRYSRVVIAIDSKPSAAWIEQAKLFLKRRRVSWALCCATFAKPKRGVALTTFESRHFKNFIWQALFAKSLPFEDFELVTSKTFRICTIPWNVFQSSGLLALKFGKRATYPMLDTRGFDIFIAQTPYPGRVDASTALVIRYHDALPILMPNLFANKSRHQATHYHALLSNVRNGAYFACVSEATRADLLQIFPELGDRAVTIPNIVSHHFYDEESSLSLASGVIRSRLNINAVEAGPAFGTLAEKEIFYATHLGSENLRYLLMVSTIEPRKNHVQLIAAWERLRATTDPSLKLVFVGNLGWDTGPIMKAMRSWIDRGAIFVLNGVPADDLRVLYRHAAATICPSLAEGFDFSGIECMRSGGIAIASDIPVHREVYGNAAVYFAPYDVVGLAKSLGDTLYSADTTQICNTLRASGFKVSEKYLERAILPEWERFLARVVEAPCDGERARLVSPPLVDR